MVSDQGVLVGLHTQDHQSLCTAVTICATLVVPKCLLSILTPLTLKSRSNPRHLLLPCQMHPLCKFGNRRSVACRDNADISIFYDVLKVGQGDLVLCTRTVHQYVHCPRVQDFRSLCPVVTICDTIYVTDRRTDYREAYRQTVFVQNI